MNDVWFGGALWLDKVKQGLEHQLESGWDRRLGSPGALHALQKLVPSYMQYPISVQSDALGGDL